jgi:SAM-dependent methyltransferase
MRVLDFGCGTGILSFFAERAGAARVYAVDRSPFVRLAEAIGRRNGFSRIEYLMTDGGPFELPEKVDVIVSEWLGLFALREGMLTPLIAARDAHLAPGGKMIPASVQWRGALLIDSEVHRERSFLRGAPYGIDFSLVDDWAFSDVLHRVVQPSQLSVAFPMSRLDTSSVAKEPDLVEGRLILREETRVYGICGWFEATLSSSVALDTGPDAPPTHWRQMIFPFPHAFTVRANDEARVAIRVIRFDDRATHWQWSIATSSDTISWDDFAYRAHLAPR